VVLIPFPFTDLSSRKVRLALIVGRISGNDLIVAFITSLASPQRTSAICLVSTDDPEFSGTGLRVTSTVRLDKIATLERRLVARRLGHIGPGLAASVADALCYVFEI
jgi:mRNA interferase MazF